MKVVILDSVNTEKVINSFIASGYDDFIAFGEVDIAYYSLNNIKIIKLNHTLGDSTAQRLEKIKGSLGGRFILAYSHTDKDVDSIVCFHKQHGGILTVIEENKRLVCAISEPEIFDYLEGSLSLEKEIFLKVASDGEMGIYK